MIVPVLGAIERIPNSLLEASGDLGARNRRTMRGVILPLALPGIVAGSIFTFSLTLGDFITPLLVGGASSEFIGNVVYSNIGTANNLPFAATLALVPIAIMVVYLSGARALGAFRRCGRRESPHQSGASPVGGRRAAVPADDRDRACNLLHRDRLSTT